MNRPYGISDFAFPNRWARESGPDVVERAGRASHRGREQQQIERSRTIYRGHHQDYSLRESQVRTLTDVGKFRVVPADDLARFGYNGDRSQMESDLRNLARLGLVEQHTIEGHSSYSTRVLTLTKDGHLRFGFRRRPLATGCKESRSSDRGRSTVRTSQSPPLTI